MEYKVSKAQTEVWEWKERAWENLKYVPEDKKIAAIKEHVKAAKEWILQKRKEKQLEA